MPFDNSVNPTKAGLAKIKYPVEYFIAIHQKTGQSSTQIIGQSERIISELKIE
jgi:hypothetical protein